MNVDWEQFIVRVLVKKSNVDLNNPLNESNVISVSGTGFFLSNQLILTCYHVVRYAEYIEVVYKQTTSINAKLLFVFPDDDIALLSIENPIKDSMVLDFYKINTKIKNMIYAIGFPMESESIIVTKGIISGYRNSLIQIDASLNPGNSGGPLVIFISEENKWKLIGVNIAKNTNGENIGFVLPIYRFFILFNLIIAKSKGEIFPIVIRKPLWLFKYQLLKQSNLKDNMFRRLPNYKVNTFYKTNKGIRVSDINKNNYLTKYFASNDVLLEINGKPIDINGYVKMDFFPEKISVRQINLWFSINEILTIKVLKWKTKKIEDVKVKLEFYELNLFNYYKFDNYPKYYMENNNFIFSIVTTEHINNIDDLNLSSHTIVQILSRTAYMSDLFTVYLSNLNPKIYKNSKFNKFPLGKIIVEINNIKFTDLESFLKVLKEPVRSFKTVDNEIYYAEYSMTNKNEIINI